MLRISSVPRKQIGISFPQKRSKKGYLPHMGTVIDYIVLFVKLSYTTLNHSDFGVQGLGRNNGMKKSAWKEC